MKEFRNLTPEERSNILDNHVTTELIVNKDTLGFEDIELFVLNPEEEFYYPSEKIDVEPKHLAMTFNMHDDKGRWLRTMIRTYLEGGKISYRRFDDQNFIVKLIFPAQTQSD